MKCRLWDMVKVFEQGKEATVGAERLFQCVTNSFTACNVPLENIVGCCFDGCQTMIGEKSGLKARLQNAIPGIVCVQCTAHSTHLNVQHALQELPSEIINLVTNIYNMLISANKLHDFEELKAELGLENLGLRKHKILRMSLTRWLSLEKCIIRLLEQWFVIFVFAEKLKQKGDALAKDVFSMMQKSEVTVYFLVLKQILHDLN